MLIAIACLLRDHHRRARRQVCIYLWYLGIHPLTRFSSRYFARVVQVFPPRPVHIPSSPEPQASTSASPLSSDDEPIHKIAEDLRVSVNDSVAKDDPNRYYYKVQILEEERQPGATKHATSKSGKQNKFSGSLMDVQCRDMGYVTCDLPVLFHNISHHRLLGVIGWRSQNPSYDGSFATVSTASLLSRRPGWSNR